MSTSRPCSGKGCNEKNYRHYLEVSKLHDAYIESLTYTEDERNARYEQDTTEFDTVTYYSYAVKASDFETKSDSSTDSTEATNLHGAVRGSHCRRP